MLFIDALSDDQVQAMRLRRDYAGHAEIELERRADAMRARDVASAASQLHAEDGFPMGPTHKRLLEIICECGGDRTAVIERHRAELKVTCRPCDSRTPEERREAMKKECEEKVREWFRKKGIKVQSRDPPA